MARRTREPLPFPMLVASGELPCARCLYDLTGLGDSRVCPECGLKIGPEMVLCLVGVPRRVETRLWRRVAWGFIVVFGVLFSQLWLLLMMKMGVLVPLTGLTMLVAAVVGMFLTGHHRSTRTTERMVFCWAGIGRSSWGSRDPGAGVMEWPSVVRVEVKAVGSVWQQLRVFEIRDGGGKKRFFECGFRCERERGPWVRDAIEALARGDEVVPEDELVESSVVGDGLGDA